MSALRFASFTTALLASGAVFAQAFDGSVPLECSATNGQDCLPLVTACTQLKPDAGKPPVLGINFAKKEVRSPFRTSLLKVDHTTTNAESLVLQGADLLFAWSVLVNKSTGAMTLAIADRKGAYVVFGKCKAIAAKSGG